MCIPKQKLLHRKFAIITADEVEERVETIGDSKENELSLAGDSQDELVGTKTDSELIERSIVRYV